MLLVEQWLPAKAIGDPFRPANEEQEAVQQGSLLFIQRNIYTFVTQETGFLSIPNGGFH